MVSRAGFLVVIGSWNKAIPGQISALIRRDIKKLLLSSFSLDLPSDCTIKRLPPCLAQGDALTTHQICSHSDLGLLSLHSGEW